jgi:hypothetical protein
MTTAEYLAFWRHFAWVALTVSLVGLALLAWIGYIATGIKGLLDSSAPDDVPRH